MWTAHPHTLDPQTTCTRLSDSTGAELTFRAVIDLWADEPAFRTYYTDLLREAACDAFFWETPPITDRTADRPFEFVVVAAPGLGRAPADPGAFRSQFAAAPADRGVIHFPNLGRDATLVVPTPVGDRTCYPHLAQFLRSAPAGQIDQFWQTVGETMRTGLSRRPTWLSTAGLGVPWLHLRLDTQPKYYRHAPYRTSSSNGASSVGNS